VPVQSAAYEERSEQRVGPSIYAEHATSMDANCNCNLYIVC
jgi:hypothetical protein